MRPLAVTKVTVEYVDQGRRFIVVFDDPTKIESIVFSKREFDRIPKPKTDPNEFEPGSRVPETIQGNRSHATSSEVESGETEPIVAATNRSLWWHTEECNWFHPKGERQ